MTGKRCVVAKQGLHDRPLAAYFTALHCLPEINIREWEHGPDTVGRVISRFKPNRQPPLV
jgi:hypothetical protein